MSSAVGRARRHQLILELVRSRAIPSQEALAEALRGHGHSVTQSTLSRDLRELRVSRVPQPGGYRYLPANEPEGAAVRSSGLSLGKIAIAEVVAVDANEVSAVLRTQVGRAQGVAAYLDGLALADVLSTVAGDDTVLVVPRTIKRIAQLERQLRELFELPVPTPPGATPQRRKKP